jgi:hypothetical protein
MIVIDFVVNAVILGSRYEMLQAQGTFLVEPRFPFMPLWVVILLATGIAMVWLYAAARPRLGPGPKTAITIGLIVGLVANVPPHFATASWASFAASVPFTWMLGGIVNFVVGSLAGAAVYKET